MFIMAGVELQEEILANNRSLIEQGVEFFFPVDPQDI